MGAVLNVPSREAIQRLQDVMVNMPQAEVETSHYFSGGMYCRKVSRKEGTLIVGKVHKAHHFFLVAAGEIIVWTETGMRTLRAGDVIESKPGTKRVTLATTDAVGITVHRTDHTDPELIEEELIEYEEDARFDALNHVKGVLLEGELS